MDKRCTRHRLESIPTKREIIQTDEGAAAEEEVVRGGLEGEEEAAGVEDQDVDQEEEEEEQAVAVESVLTTNDIKQFFVVCPLQFVSTCITI